MTRKTAGLISSLLVAWLALASTASATTAPLTVLGGQDSERTVTFSEASDHSLTGQLALAIRSRVDENAELGVSYYPTGSAEGPAAGSVEFLDGSAPTLEKGHVTSTALTFTLPPGSSPADLKGVVVLRAIGAAKAPAQLDVSGVGSALAGVSIRPEKLNVRVVDVGGPLGNPSKAYANVQLSGPGVPSLFVAGARPPTFNLLLRSDHGDRAHATLVNVTQGSEPTLATATVRIEGDLGAGKFEGTVPISNLSTEAPKLTVAVESGDSVIYAVLAVFLGTALGGGLYLASNRHRRKVLLRDQVKSMLDLYTKRLAALEHEAGEGELPIWSLADDLGPEENWYTVKWDSILNFDGAVQTVWSEIHWARDDGDLERAATQALQLRSRIVRWLTVANSVQVLQAAVKLDPKALPNELWKSLRVRKDSEDLLQLVRQLEPPDDQTAQGLVDRIERQAHWHTVLARAWHAKAALTRDMDRGDGYGPNDTAALQAIDLAKLDREGAPESGRKLEQQIALEYDVAAAMETIRATYRGKEGGLELEGASPSADGPPSRSAALAATGAILEPTDGAFLAPVLTEAARVEPQDKVASLVRGSAAVDHAGGRIPATVKWVLYRDLGWTIAIALVSSAFYILGGVYTASWGTATDYVSAFAAGFIGKAVISWAALPLFQSVRSAAAGTPVAPVVAAAPASSPAAPVAAPGPAPAVPAPPPAPAGPPAPPAPAGGGVAA